MSLFLAINIGYINFEIGLYQDDILLGVIKESNKAISKQFVYLLNFLLVEHNKNVYDLDFIAANQGPAPFTSLRAILASINGISFITKVSLLGINGIACLLEQEIAVLNNNKLVVLLNAFCQEIYYGIYNQEKKYMAKSGIETGVSNINNFLEQLQKTRGKNTKINFIGNGAELYKDNIYIYFPEAVIYNRELKIDFLSKKAMLLWQESLGVPELMPLYLRDI